MKLFSTSAAAAAGMLALLTSSAAAHTIMTTIFVDEKRVADGSCMRMDMNGAKATGPIAEVSSNEMACGRDGNSPVAFVCPTAAGAKLTFQYRVQPDDPSRGSIAYNHKGPCSFYLKKVDDHDLGKATAAGPGWFKIFDLGYDARADKWCTEKIIAQNGLFSITLPTGLPGGSYLVRSELLALHQAYRGDGQFFVGCAQVFVTTAGSNDSGVLRQAETVSIPGYVDGSEPSINHDIFADPKPADYKPPGPAPWFPVSDARVGKKQTVGNIADDCLLTNGNWCGFDLAPYRSEKECWASIDKCYEQGSACYETAPPTGSHNCDNWNEFCRRSEPLCKSEPSIGPSSKAGKITSVDPKAPSTFPPGLSPARAYWVDVAAKRRRTMVRSRRPAGRAEHVHVA